MYVYPSDFHPRLRANLSPRILYMYFIDFMCKYVRVCEIDFGWQKERKGKNTKKKNIYLL